MLFYQDIFLSINGESRSTGLPTTFVRLWGCPVKCSYCDQPQPRSERKRISVERLVETVRKLKCPRVCITGGEPLIQNETIVVVYDLVGMGYEVSIETSGCVPIEPDHYTRSFRYVMDIKCPSSGVSHANVLENLKILHEKDEVKVVIKNREDYDYFLDVWRKHPTRASILISPVTKKSLRYGYKPMIGKDLIDWVLQDKCWNVRVGYQLHKVMGVM